MSRRVLDEEHGAVAHVHRVGRVPIHEIVRRDEVDLTEDVAASQVRRRRCHWASRASRRVRAIVAISSSVTTNGGAIITAYGTGPDPAG